jgi:hypothetical protein
VLWPAEPETAARPHGAGPPRPGPPAEARAAHRRFLGGQRRRRGAPRGADPAAPRRRAQRRGSTLAGRRLTATQPLRGPGRRTIQPSPCAGDPAAIAERHRRRRRLDHRGAGVYTQPDHHVAGHCPAAFPPRRGGRFPRQPAGAGFVSLLDVRHHFSAVTTGPLVSPPPGYSPGRAAPTTRGRCPHGFRAALVLASAGAGFRLAAAFPGPGGIAAAALLVSAGVDVVTPTGFTRLAASAPADRLGRTMGAGVVGCELGDAGGPILVGAAYAVPPCLAAETSKPNRSRMPGRRPDDEYQPPAAHLRVLRPPCSPRSPTTWTSHMPTGTPTALTPVPSVARASSTSTSYVKYGGGIRRSTSFLTPQGSSPGGSYGTP